MKAGVILRWIRVLVFISPSNTVCSDIMDFHVAMKKYMLKNATTYLVRETLEGL